MPVGTHSCPETLTAAQVRRLARDCGFELAGVAPAEPVPEAVFFLEWVRQGMAGEMSYLTGRRAQMRLDPRSLLPTARSVICVGKLYNTAGPSSIQATGAEQGWISRYAWGEDYHAVLRRGLERLVACLEQQWGRFEWKICVDTAPLLERALARRAGLGWIGKNTCLINQPQGSWFFLGELLVSLEIEPDCGPPPDRCGSCTRCIEACPTQAIVPTGRPDGPAWALDSRLCISYFTIELRGPIPEERRPDVGRHVFGCDICQDVCPWNRKAPRSLEPAFQPAHAAPSLEELAELSEEDFRSRFGDTPVARARYRGFLRNVAVAMGNAGRSEFRPALERLAAHPDPLVAEHAQWALRRLEGDR
ncbi:MAG: tRNA epoxyqueuosine(34) reductase QueG [Bryobacteraceae bacterium]|nr:tRNA epoxyqueuosine(34) reductase QueG [Bryobacteraceae bacterium]